MMKKNKGFTLVELIVVISIMAILIAVISPSLLSRLERAKQEYAEADFYTYLVINDNADVAAEELSSIITAEHCLFPDRKYVLK